MRDSTSCLTSSVREEVASRRELFLSGFCSVLSVMLPLLLQVQFVKFWILLQQLSVATKSLRIFGLREQRRVRV